MLIALCVAFVCLIGDEPVTSESLINKHEESLARIHSLRAMVESSGSADGGSTWHLLESVRLVRSGRRERGSRSVRAIISKGGFEPLSENFAIWLNTPEGTWGLEGIDPDHPPTKPISYIEHEITHKGPRITGRISAPSKRGPHGYEGTPVATALGFVVSYHSLREMRNASGNVVPVKGFDSRGDSTWVMSLKALEGNSAYEVHLNPKYAYMISEWRCVGTAGAYRGLVASWQVTEFQEPSPGVFIAKNIRQTGEDPEFKNSLIVASTIAVSDANQPIPDSDLRLDYPAGAVIGDERDQTFNIWGNGKPELTFKSQSEFRNWRVAQITQALKARPAWWRDPLILTAIGSVLVLLALLIYRSRLVRRERAAT